MKRKTNAGPAQPEIEDPADVVSPAILEGARRSLDSERPGTVTKCMVCASEATSGGEEPLCWVCRRLKISAWRDVDNQLSSQE